MEYLRIFAIINQLIMEIDNSTDVLETVIFTDLVEQKVILSEKDPELIILLLLITTEYDLDLSDEQHYDICKHILINSVKYN
jgi:hypothetical protein